MFSPERTTQVCAEFTRRAGGSINVLKLVKLTYLCDRMSMERYAASVTYDTYVSMDHGPVPSGTLNLINNYDDPDWNRWMKEREGYELTLKIQEFVHEDLDELSAADLKIVDETWKKFGGMDEWDLSRHTHEHCAEWKYPGGTSIPIMEWEIFHALGWSLEDAELAQQRIQEQRQIERVLCHA